MRVGFIGLGAMGKGMASNLLKAGHEVCVWNRSKEPVEAMVAQGATAAQEPREAFEADVLVSMLADDAVTRAVVLDSGALEAARPGLIHLSMATLSVAFVTEMMERHVQAGVQFISAPVFGRTDVAEAGKLNIVVAGPQAAVDTVQPLLDAMGQTSWPLGEDPLRATIVKISGNFMLASAIETMGEAAALSKSYGVEPADLLNILTNTLFAAPAYKNYGAMIAEQRFEPAAFKLTLGLKDVGLALSAGQAKHVPLPFGSVLRDNLLEAVAQGEGHLDWSALGGRALKRSGQA
ncbi:3-hydroxyisobutyrate dehydrogenase-like beta-hydroxyacid dehydrogenase [Pseudomonas duriflava]|uniref:3-hydroxyisobutyrate dehydrogenase-like beta-hydroxyacid dehydrogenase n=1 Tax=Pseudomonas duriflava TaxID=459528 RepID=A0A562QL91_9PSED|nr:NAD(P)-dependent oxidoreductase [Pseudomonas duriflava]TWI57517.1 3-hydroxyisobutyrate dehydrogenase-like beta-hydroxyacid dehydrogenase [Pseudomonas duriflava]